MLLMKMDHQQAATAGGATFADALLPTPCADGELSPLSAAKEEEYTKRIRELELDQKQSQFTIDEYARQCMQKGNLTVQLDQVRDRLLLAQNPTCLPVAGTRRRRRAHRRPWLPA